MKKRVHPKKLLVEGREDQRVIPELIEANGVTWGETADSAIVFIEEFEGVDNLLQPGVIEAELKASGAEIVGVLIDADDDPPARWSKVRERCLKLFPELPEEISPNGVVSKNADSLKLGVWLMPDNQSHGMLESFLTFLLPDTEDQVFTHAKDACRLAKEMGAPFRDVHLHKSHIHTWLAWQDEPGRQLHQAIKESILDAASPHAAPFVDWFRELFEI